MEKRLEKRLLHCMDLMYGGNDTFSPGSTRNISSHGMLIQAENQIFPIQHEIKVMLTIGSEIVSLRGIVCWNSEYQSLEPLTEKQLGLFIPTPPAEYLEYIDRLN
jgi:hypothetical protein